MKIKRKVCWLTTELDNVGTDTRVFASQAELDQAMNSILAEAWSDHDIEGPYPDHKSPGEIYVDMDTVCPAWASENTMWWGADEIEFDLSPAELASAPPSGRRLHSYTDEVATTADRKRFDTAMEAARAPDGSISASRFIAECQRVEAMGAGLRSQLTAGRLDDMLDVDQTS